MTSSNMTGATVTRIALFLAVAHGLLLRGGDERVNLLPLLSMDLLDLLPLLRQRQRRIRTHRHDLMAYPLRNHASLLERGFANSCNPPARFRPRRPRVRRG
jgi:hypothetical protein